MFEDQNSTLWILHYHCHLLVNSMQRQGLRPVSKNSLDLYFTGNWPRWPTLTVVWLCLYSDICRRFDSLSHRDVPFFQCSHSPLNLNTHTHTRFWHGWRKQQSGTCNFRETAARLPFSLTNLALSLHCIGGISGFPLLDDMRQTQHTWHSCNELSTSQHQQDIFL